MWAAGAPGGPGRGRRPRRLLPFPHQRCATAWLPHLSPTATTPLACRTQAAAAPVGSCICLLDQVPNSIWFSAAGGRYGCHGSSAAAVGRTFSPWTVSRESNARTGASTGFVNQPRVTLARRATFGQRVINFSAPMLAKSSAWSLQSSCTQHNRWLPTRRRLGASSAVSVVPLLPKRAHYLQVTAALWSLGCCVSHRITMEVASRRDWFRSSRQRHVQLAALCCSASCWYRATSRNTHILSNR